MTGKTTPLHSEPVRAWIAQLIQQALIPGQRVLVPVRQPEDIKRITGFRIGPSEVRLRVQMNDDTFRTFTVTLRENR